jgi:hypothetical protein
LDIIINEEQSKLLNSFWTSSFLNNAEKTFFFKFHNNTLGYKNAVAHFVRGHSPNCTFCDLSGNVEINNETALHLFFECPSVGTVIDQLFIRLTNDANFSVSKREFFANFERRELNIAQSKILFVFSKLLIKYLWDCRNHAFLPSV